MGDKMSVEDLLNNGYTRIGSKSYCSYWKKGEHILTVYDNTHISEAEQLRSSLKEVLEKLESLQEQHWKDWKEKADMMDQGASVAYEHSYWLLKEVLDE